MATPILEISSPFRQPLITEDHVVSAYSLQELVSSTARDIAFDKNPGTYHGSSLTRGVSMTTVCEGALGCTFDGTGYVEVADDGGGFLEPGDAAGRSLSLTGGSMNIITLLKQAASYAARIMADGATGFWRFGESSGTVAAAVVGTDGAYSNSPTLGQTGPISDGKTAVEFVASGSGAGDAGSYASATISVPGSAWSVAVWVKRSAAPSTDRYIASQSDIPLRVYVAGTTSVVTVVGPSGTITGTVSVADGAWHYVVVTYDGTTAKLYVDAVLDGSV